MTTGHASVFVIVVPFVRLQCQIRLASGKDVVMNNWCYVDFVTILDVCRSAEVELEACVSVVYQEPRRVYLT